MPPGHAQKPHDQDGGDDDGDKPFPRYPEDDEDLNLVPNNNPISAGSTFIPVPGAVKSNVPSPLGPRDHLYRHTGDRNIEQQRKKRVSNEPWELTGPKRQNTNNLSRGRGKSSMETHNRESHETNQSALSRTNRSSTARLKSEQLKEGLAGGSATNNMKDVQKEERFSIPHDHLQNWMLKKQPVRNAMSLDAAESEDEDGLDIRGECSFILLTHFRRGRFVLGGNTLVSICLDAHGKFKVFEGGLEQKEYGFLLDQVKNVWMNKTKDYVQIVLNREHISIPNGQQIWWRLKEPCLDIEPRFFKGIHCEIKATPKIEEREDKFNSLPELQPLVIYKPTQDYGQEAITQKHPDSGPLNKGTRDARNTRSRNAQRAKPATSLLFGVEDSNDTYLGSLERPLSLMSRADRDKPPLVWPLAGKKRVTVEYQDLERLEEEQFLNDNIINFYLRFLEEKLARDNPALAQQTHFFNTFFYERLCQKTADRKANFQALMKWTARVDLFAKQYVIIPINENAHWYLAIICNLPHLEVKLQANTENSQAEEAEATTVSTPDFPLEEDGASSEVEPPLVAEATVRGLDRMEIDDPNQQRPTTAEGQLLSELSSLKPANPPEPMDIDEPDSDHEDEWPSEEGLEGVSDHHISEFNYYSGDGKVIVNTDDPDKRGVKRQKKPPARVKKPPKPVDLNNPTIIILDSLNISWHPRTFSLLREYLEVEAAEKKGWIIPRGVVGGIYAKVPKQPNHCDCGVYLLCYVEGFLQAAEAIAQEFLQKVDCQKGLFDEEAFTGKRQELRGLIIRLHEEQYGDQGKNDVAIGRAVEAQVQLNGRRAPSGEIQEPRHEGGGPRPVERGAVMKEEDLMDLVNDIQSRSSAFSGSTSIMLSSGIQSRRFTPTLGIEQQTGLGPTRSSHFSHVEILSKARASSPASLQSSPSSSLESTPITTEPWHPPLRLHKSPSAPQNNDYAVSVSQDLGATVSTEL